jgi:hypothetical protein
VASDTAGDLTARFGREIARVPKPSPSPEGVHPVSTDIVVSALARPEGLVEIDTAAVLAA